MYLPFSRATGLIFTRGDIYTLWRNSDQGCLVQYFYWLLELGYLQSRKHKKKKYPKVYIKKWVH